MIHETVAKTSLQPLFFDRFFTNPYFDTLLSRMYSMMGVMTT